MKKCKDCGETKPRTDFYAQKSSKDGLFGSCKECTCIRVRKNRQDSPNARECDKRRYKNNPDRQKTTTARSKQWREDHPDKYKAQTAVNNALRDGRLIRMPCEVCGSETNIHGHHDDYTKPLDVRWLCPVHHQEIHSRIFR